MIADTVKSRIVAITTIQPIKAIGRLKILRSGSLSMKGKRGQQRHEGARQRHGAQELPELAGEHLQPQQLEQEQEIPLRLRMIVARIRRRFFQAAPPAPRTPARK